LFALLAGLILLAALLVALALAIAVLGFLLFPTGFLLTQRLAQHARVVLGVLLEILDRNPVTCELCVAGQTLVLVNDLLRRSPHFAFGAGAVEYPVDYIPGRTAIALVPGA
jgi:hypothetical protein